MNIVGITSYPSGFAHTPMAAKALEKAGTSYADGGAPSPPRPM